MTTDDAPRLDWTARLPATWALLAVLVVVHLATGWVEWRHGHGAFRSFLGARGVGFRVAVGGQYAPLVDAGQSWRLWTSVLLHGDALHLLVNAVSLAALGRLLEPIVGPTRWLAWFAGGGLAGSLLSQAVGVVQSDGASGGAFALLGAAVALGWRYRGRLDADDAWLLGPVLWGFAAVNVALSFVLPFVDAAGHLGGLLLGLLWGFGARLDRAARPADVAVISVFVTGCVIGFWRCFAG